MAPVPQQGVGGVYSRHRDECSPKDALEGLDDSPTLNTTTNRLSRHDPNCCVGAL